MQAGYAGTTTNLQIPPPPLSPPKKKFIFSSSLKQATKKIPESNISNPKMFFDHHLKSGVPVKVVLILRCVLRSYNTSRAINISENQPEVSVF